MTIGATGPVGVICVAIALLGGESRDVARAQATRLEYRVVFANERELPRRLDEAGQQGFACAMVARPDPNVPLAGVVVVMSRPAGSTPKAVTHRVVRGGGGAANGLPPLLDRAAADGYRLCGIALDEAPPIPSLVAVMTSTSEAGRRHGAEVLTDYRGAIGRLNTAGKDGFVPIAVAPLNNNRVPDLRNWIVITEQPASGRAAIEVAVRSATGPDTLQRNLGEQTKQGYRIALAWKEGNDFVAMMTRPAGASSAAPTYAVDSSTPMALHSLSARYIADFPYLSDQRLAITEKSGLATNDVIEDPLPAFGATGFVVPGPLGDHLTALHDATVMSVTVRRGDRGGPVLRTVLTSR
jgi:hypothetical protein